MCCIFQAEAPALGENDLWVTGFPPWYYGHRSLFPLNPTLKQGKKQELWSKKKVWFLKHILCFYPSLFLSFSLFLSIPQEKTFFFFFFYYYLNIALNTSITGWCDSTNTFQIQMDLYHLRSSKWSPHVLNELMAHMWQPETCLSQAGTKSHKLWISPRDSFRYASLLSNLFTIVLHIRKK